MIGLVFSVFSLLRKLKMPMFFENNILVFSVFSVHVLRNFENMEHNLAH